jgi:hypothetical protein
MSKPKNRIICPDCGKPKMVFESESKAKNFIKFNGDDIEFGSDMRPYYCPACCGWHISHKQYRKSYEGRTDKLIELYRNEKKHARPIDYENIEILYKDLKNHNFKSRKEVNQYLREMEKWTYNGFVKQEAKLRYYKETGI